MSSRRARLDLEIGAPTTGEQLFQVQGGLLSWHLLPSSLSPTQSHLGLKAAHTPGMDWDEMCNVELPIPTYEEQKQIVDGYNAIRDRIALKKQINDNLAA